MREEDVAALDVHLYLRGEEFGAAGAREVFAQHHVAVAGHDEEAVPEARVELELRDDGFGRRHGVVADPEVKEVAEDDEFGIVRGDVLHEAEEPHDRGGLLRREVEVGNENRIFKRGGFGDARFGRDLFDLFGHEFRP